ncbi:hypothetical protein VTK73DRAFT_3000 [Phialemonium thermophilum]|uniref:Polyprenal reductase n=1 Tax=Phialemonium thermophilum TaxID=223376 RepID=A0ABR3Y1T8_9PEZI
MGTAWCISALSAYLTSSTEYLLSLPPASLCQLYFILASCGVLAVAAAPATARPLLLNYGARKSGAQDADNGREESPDRRPGPFVRLVATVTSWGQIPHSWFITFYVSYIASSLFWLLQYLTRGSVLQTIATRQAESAEPSMSGGQVALVWTAMLVQACRRLYEHLAVFNPSTSKMWVVHWLLGESFYLCTSVAVWVDGPDPILRGQLRLADTPLALTWKRCAALLLAVAAWISQYRCHKHLAGLKKYSLPSMGMFRSLVCPHYTAECILYLSLAVCAAPEGRLYNKTLLCALAFVAVNLGVTAGETRRWYVSRFGPESVAGKWNMVPWIF